MSVDQIVQLIQSAIQFGTVILFGAMGEILTEKSGNLNLGVPGDLCQQYPQHDNAHEVVAKIAMIGRAYSASVERRKNAETTSDRDFYYGYVAPLIVDSDLDKRLDALRKYQTPTTKNLPEILATHLYLQELLKKATEMNKRSFASKLSITLDTLTARILKLSSDSQS